MKRFLSLLLAIVMVVSLLPLDIAAAAAKHTEEYQEITAENWTASMIRQSAEEHHRVYYVLASDGNYYPVEYAKMAYYLAAPTPVNIYGNFSAVSGTLFEASYGSLSRSEGHDDQMLYCYLGQSGGTSEGEMRAVYYNTNPKTGYYATTLFYYQNSLTGTDVQDLYTWNQALGNRTVQLLGASEEWEYGWQSGVGTTPFANSSYDGTLYYQYTQPEHDNAVYYTRGNDERVELAMPKIGSDESVGYTGTLYYSPDGIDPETPQNTPELPSNDYYTVFSKNTSTLAPGVEQNIYYAETADDSQQMVFYTATVDLTREDLAIYANYNENDGNATGTSCLTDQIAAAARNHADVENYTPVVGVNGDFFNMNTSVPSGVLVMEGEIFKENSSNRNFFAIKNDETAMLGSAEDWQTVRDEVKEAIGVGDILVRDGQIVSSSSGANNRVARTCVGITSDGNVVLMVIDGRQEPFSCGGNYQEIAQIMLDAGCVQAANLDGGGSSTFAAREEGEDHIRVVNRPADGVERSISSSLLVVSTAKTADGGAAHPLIQADDGTLLGYFGVGGEVALPETVTVIGAAAFQNCQTVTKLTLPESVTEIGNSAFYDCKNLTYITLPNSLTGIGSSAFQNCRSLTSAEIPNGVTSIESALFRRCANLESVAIPVSVTEIGENAFYGCSNLSDVYYAGTKAQWNQITIGECENNPLESASIHCADGDLSLIGYELADYLIDGAEYLIVSTNREGEAFALANNGGAVDAIPVTISNGLIKLSDSTAVWTVKLSSSIFFTYRYALVNDGAYLIGSVGLSLASSMGSSTNAWTYDDGLKSGTSSLYYDSAEQRFSTSLNTNSNRVYLFVKQGTDVGGTCGETVSWALSEDGLLTISGAGEISDYSLPLLITSSIAPWAQYRDRITALSIDDGVTRIGNNAFALLSNLRGTLLIPESVTSIGNSAFSGCGGLTGELVIPESVTSIGNSAFSSCSGFTGELVIPENVTSVGNYAFSGCSGFTGELVIPDGVQELNKKAFGGMTGVTSIVVGEQVRSIFTSAEEPETNPFGGSTSVTEIKFRGETVPTLTEDASPFDSLTSLERIIVPAAAYDDYVAAYSKYLPEGAEIVPDGALARVHGLAADRVYSKTAALSWDADADGVIAGYKVLRDGAEIGDVTDCAFVDRALEPGLTYTYTVRGYAADGRVTLPATIEVTTAEPRVTDIQTENSLNKIGLTNNTVTIYAADTNNLLPLGDERTTGELYYVLDGHRSRIGEAQLGENGVYTIHWDVTDVQDGEYTLVFVLTDVDGSSDEYSEKVTVDRTRPAKIVGVAAIADETVIHLTWSISAEVETSRYNIYRRAEDEDTFRRLTQITSRNTLSYTDSSVEKGKVYEYYVVGVNAVDVESAEYDVVGAALLDDTAAPTVTRLIPANATYLTGRKDLGIRAEDNVSVTRSAIYYSLDGGESWTLLDERSGGEWSVSFDTTALPDGEMRVKGVAFDAAGNESDPLVYVYSIDNTGPARVEGVTWESTSVTATLRWNDVADDDLRFYRVERLQPDGSYALVTDVNGTLGANLYNLAPETSYTYRVVGYDLRGNRGVPSEDVTVTTQADTTNPVITSIRPLSGSYNTSIPVVLKASDEYGVQRIVLQTSVDGMAWTDAAEQTYTTVQKDRTWSCTLSLADYADGALYVRGVAADFAGNESDTGETAPFVQHLVDKTAPAAPQQVAARGDNGYVEISWVQGPEPDLNTYTVWRASAENGSFTAIASGIRAINCFDRNAAAGVTYWYYVTVTDKTGNVSAASETVSAAALTDDEPPEIVSIYPASGEAVGAGYRTVSVLARDNRSLDRVVIEYSADGETFRTLKTGSNLNTYSTTVTAQIPLSEFSDGDTVWLRARAYDASGSVSEDAAATYVVDLTAPALSGTMAQYFDGGVTVQWTGGMEDDLAGYRIYRRAANGSSYSLIAQRQAVSGQSRYSCTDYGISLAGASYVYKIEAMDSCGNVRSVETSSVTVPDRTAPTPKLSCESVMEVGVEYVFDATASKDNQAIASWHFDFGDGTESREAAPIHVYGEIGTYTVRLTVTDDEGNQAVLIKEITVRDRTAVGSIRIHIADEYGKAVPNAPVYFDLGSDEQVVRGTDSAGNVTFTAAVGRHIVGCVIADNEWLPVKKEVIVTAGETTTVSMTLVHHPMIEGQFEINRMTFEEIVAAGIDVSNPENQHIVKVDVAVVYGSQPISDSFLFNPSTGTVIARPTIVNTPDGRERKLTPVVIYSPSAFDINGNWNANSNLTLAFLDVPVEASFLKEFFDVKLHIINNAASTFSMTDNVITLNVPEGLTIMDAIGAESNATVVIPEITGQETITITWILRGDTAGSYPISADYSGILAEFNEPIHAQFVAEDPIQVYGLDALKLIVELNSKMNYDGFYFNLSIQNTGGADMYLPTVDVIGDSISSYLVKIAKEKEESEATETITPKVELLNQLLTNSSGYAQYIGKDQTVTTLAPGMTLTKRYVAYEATGYPNLLYFYDAAKEITAGYGAQVEICETDIDLFPQDHAMDKVTDIRMDSKKFSAYSEITEEKNFFYVQKAISNDENFFLRASEIFYDTRQEFNFDFNYSGDEMKKLTRGLVVQLLCDESMQQAISINTGMKQLSVVSSALNATASMLSQRGLNGDAAVLMEYVKTGNNLRKMTQKVFDRSGEGDSMGGRLLKTIGYTGVSAAARNAIQSYYDSNPFHGVILTSVSDACKKVSGILGEIQDKFNAYEQSVAMMSDLMQIAAAHEEADALLSILMDGINSEHNVYKALEDIKRDMDNARAAMLRDFGDRISTQLIQGSIQAEITSIITLLDLVYGTTIGAIIALVKVAFSTIDYVFNWTGTMTDLHVLRTECIFTRALIKGATRYHMNPPTEEEAYTLLKALKYLVKMHIIGEQSFVDIVNEMSDHEQSVILEQINEQKGSAFTSLDAYAADVRERMLRIRDGLFSTYYTTLDIPEAPEVSVDYYNGKTNEAFGSAYEYSFDGVHWTRCSGEIPIEPGYVTKTLRVRQAESLTDFSGNAATVIVAARTPILGDFTAEFDGSAYVVRGLYAGEYLYSLSDTREEPDQTEQATVGEDGILRIENAEKHVFVVLELPAGDYNPVSLPRHIVVEDVTPSTAQILTQPQSASGRPGETVTFSVEAQGDGLTYQWQYCLPGETEWHNSGMESAQTDSLVIPVTEERSGQQYRCKITDVFGKVILSDTATLTVVKPAQTNPFKDVPEGKYYHDAVLWALDNRVTTGVTSNTFVPDKNCTRAQVVTFLWRAAGEPEPESMDNPFRDVSASAYYLKAVLWARENGITTGTTPPTFDPNAECTRAQVVTFLWRANGSPDPTSTTNPFKDVSASAYYFKAVLWALENGITTGKTPTTFNPDGVCTRAHVVTFLYRSMT